MKIGVLTSSRADFGIYYPLLSLLKTDSSFDLEIIAFGTHLQQKYGYTVDEIINSGFDVKHKIETKTENNLSANISNAIGDAIIKFSDFWNNNKYDLILALGDRYEMFAAVTAASPFNIDIAHIHAGETTLGAIDNAYRHAISLMSKYLFVSTEKYKNRAVEIIKRPEDVFNVGALSIDNLIKQKLLSVDEFYDKFNIDLSIPTILSTFHPETVSFENNYFYIKELIASFQELKKKYQIVITMPNSDTLGDMIRHELIKNFKDDRKVILVESFGMQGYLSCIKHCKIMIGNTSSGFVEGAFFPRWVINLGKRQDGRIQTKNMLSVNIKKDLILSAVQEVENRELPNDCNIYGNGNAASKIVSKLKMIYGVR